MTETEVYKVHFKKICYIAVWISSACFVLPAYAQFELDVEAGGVFSGYNDVRIPGEGGTLFSLSDELSADATVFYRLRLFYDVTPRHYLGVLFAPLSINSVGQVGRDLVFQDETFPANMPLEATYRFNSYRLTYFYDFLRGDTIKLGLGITAKVRDARITVRGNGRESEKSDIGFVPLIHFRLLWRLSDRFSLLLDGDALAAPQGRAEDVLLALTVRASNQLAFKAGYRILEGGADNDEVYTFALIHYASFGALIHF